MSKIKVLIVTSEMDFGGIENQLMHMLRNADREKFQIGFTSWKQDAYYRGEIESLGADFLMLDKMKPYNPLPYCRALYRILKDGKYDVIHSHELFHSGIVLLVAKLAGVRGRFVHAHNWSDDDGTGRRRGLIRTVYNAAMRCLILSCSTHRLACSSLAGKFLYGKKAVEKPGYHLVFNSVDTQKFLDRYDRREEGDFCEDGWVNVLQVGRFSTVKNQLFTARIAAELKARGKKIRILCAGNNGNEYETQVRQAIEKLGVGEHMKLLGVRSDIDVLMRKSAAFFLPSLYEGMPLVLIEAQAAGLPCVVADTFSREVDFEIGKVNWMELKDGAAAWADALEAAIDSGRADKSAVTGAVEKKRFDSKMFAKTLCELYEQSYIGAGND